MKSYSKTKPLRVEEFDPIVEWWGSESDDFASRTESEQVWKHDFKKLKREAEARAKPHWDKAESLNNAAAVFVNEIKDLRESIKGEKDAMKRAKAEEKITNLNDQIEALRQQAKEQQSIGDRHFWPIYNLDINNPKTAEEETHDADKLLSKYKALLGEIETTQTKLKNELSIALAHHFKNDAAS